MKTQVVAGLAVVASVMGSAAPAAAVPPGLAKRAPDVFNCAGETVLLVDGNGRSGWLGDTLVVLRSFEVEGSFTPEGGEPEPVVRHREFGRGPTSEAVTCTAGILDVVPGDGTFRATVTIVAVPVRRS